MLRKSTVLAVVATAALGLAMLNPTVASARGGHGGGFGGGHGGGMHGGHGGGMHGGGHGMHGGHGGRIHIGFRHHHRPHWHVRYHRPIWYAPRPVIYSGYSTYTPTYTPRVVTAGPCTCLSKEYTPEGAVLFKDRCTNEAAINPPAPAPQQTGALEPQVQQYSQQYVQPQPQAR